MKRARLLLVGIILIAFDQLTKYLATVKLKGKAGYDIIEGVFQFLYHENDGSAFGMFGGKTIFLLVFTSVILIGILYVYFRVPLTKRYLPIRIITMCLAAGAIGNMIDRFTYHYVVDFLYFELIDFPIFNVADCYITVSAGILLILCLFYYKEEDFEDLSDSLSLKKRLENKRS